MKRVFLVVLDSFGIGEAPDAQEFGDLGSNTLRSVATSKYLDIPNMINLGLYNIDGVEVGEGVQGPIGSYGRMTEKSAGKDTTIGHWEIAGIVSKDPLPTFQDGFPKELIDKLSASTGRVILCNRPYSGTEVIKDFGMKHIESGDLIVYTSADSVMQIAAHEQIIPINKLYEYCEIARRLCKDEWGVGRIIARPFDGEFPNFKRTSRRHDFSLVPPKLTMLDALKENGFDVIAIGKINDIFAGKGISTTIKTSNNEEGIERIVDHLSKDFEGICFTNLVDFDMLYGHRNDIDGYAKALTYFDRHLPRIIGEMKEEDILMITADHGCDPGTDSTDHSREYTPLLIYGKNMKSGVNIGTRGCFADIASTVIDYFEIKEKLEGQSFLNLIG